MLGVPRSSRLSQPLIVAANASSAVRPSAPFAGAQGAPLRRCPRSPPFAVALCRLPSPLRCVAPFAVKSSASPSPSRQVAPCRRRARSPPLGRQAKRTPAPLR
ncbi:hypothetical protein BD626DRAFT_160298 [Schizophyllum amplum]|uniref:Uncharacterized protein n=1 Tax=Schizophyllum amplum TaxID=97359 RepID=A0A550CP64_9AGAR|nr:hypothetical protein BD626DRAFT_160298 [Auriculariopsis ampla]